MYIKKLKINNFRLFSSEEGFFIENLNIPTGEEGSGLTLFVGENGCGKTSILDALSMPVLPYKADACSLSDFYDPTKDINIIINSDKPFTVKKTTPKGDFQSVGFMFEGKRRSRGNKAFLSTIVTSDQKFIQAEGQNIKEFSSDLRTNVNNPFSGPRFSETDFLFLDKSRTYQIRTGTYNDTRFDRLMEDRDYEYLKSLKNVDLPDLNKTMKDLLKPGGGNDHFQMALEKFRSIAGINVDLDIINNWMPHKGAFLSLHTKEGLQIGVDSLGSGYEMIFSLLYSYYLSKQKRKKLVILIDEPELHLHPSLQETFVQFLLEASKDAQIFLTSHSPLLVKHLTSNESVRINVLTKSSNEVSISKIEERVLPYESASEINYLAFGLVTKEYQTELYGNLEHAFQGNGINHFDNEFFVQKYKEDKKYPYRDEPNILSLHTYVRNCIHHPEGTHKIEHTMLGDSISRLREITLAEVN